MSSLTIASEDSLCFADMDVRGCT